MIIKNIKNKIYLFANKNFNRFLKEPIMFNIILLKKI